MSIRITSINFTSFKALSKFSVSMKHVNILVGPNNCGKSTILSAFRALKVAMQYARRKNAAIVNVDKHIYGWQIPEASIPMSLENVHTDYIDEETKVDFRFSNGNHLILFFPRDGECYLLVLRPRNYMRKHGNMKVI